MQLSPARFGFDLLHKADRANVRAELAFDVQRIGHFRTHRAYAILASVDDVGDQHAFHQRARVRHFRLGDVAARIGQGDDPFRPASSFQRRGAGHALGGILHPRGIEELARLAGKFHLVGEHEHVRDDLPLFKAHRLHAQGDIPLKAYDIRARHALKDDAGVPDRRRCGGKVSLLHAVRRHFLDKGDHGLALSHLPVLDKSDRGAHPSFHRDLTLSRHCGSHHGLHVGKQHRVDVAGVHILLHGRRDRLCRDKDGKGDILHRLVALLRIREALLLRAADSLRLHTHQRGKHHALSRAHVRFYDADLRGNAVIGSEPALDAEIEIGIVIHAVRLAVTVLIDQTEIRSPAHCGIALSRLDGDRPAVHCESEHASHVARVQPRRGKFHHPLCGRRVYDAACVEFFVFEHSRLQFLNILCARGRGYAAYTSAAERE